MPVSASKLSEEIARRVSVLLAKPLMEAIDKRLARVKTEIIQEIREAGVIEEDEEFDELDEILAERTLPKKKVAGKKKVSTDIVASSRKKAEAMIRRTGAGKMGGVDDMIANAGEYDEATDVVLDNETLSEAGTVSAAEVSGKEMAEEGIDPSKLDFSEHMSKMGLADDE